MSKKQEYLNEFVEFWKKNYRYQVVTEFRPQKELFASSGTKLKYREWLESEGLRDFRADLWFPTKGIDLIVESDGSGFGHRGAGASTDNVKVRQFLKLGYTTIRFAAQEVKKSKAFVADEIEDILDIYNGI